MDTSVEYIKMCEKAVEVQDGWRPKIGDIYSSSTPQYGVQQNKIVIIESTKYHKFSKAKTSFRRRYMFWLPRQDQLQGMVTKFSEVKVAHIIINVDKMNEDYFCKFSSMEQLWLAFVMREKYNKNWNGEDWKEE